MVLFVHISLCCQFLLLPVFMQQGFNDCTTHYIFIYGLEQEFLWELYIGWGFLSYRLHVFWFDCAAPGCSPERLYSLHSHPQCLGFPYPHIPASTWLSHFCLSHGLFDILNDGFNFHFSYINSLFISSCKMPISNSFLLELLSLSFSFEFLRYLVVTFVVILVLNISHVISSHICATFVLMSLVA